MRTSAAPSGCREIDRRRFLAAIAAEEISGDPLVALAVPRRSPVPGVVAAPGPLDLDHLGAKIGEQLRAPRPGEHAAEVEDLDPVERLQCRALLQKLPVGEHGLRRIMPRRAGHAAAGMRARPAQVEALERHPIVGRADHRPGAEQLVEAHLAVEDVAADQAEAPLEVERRMDLPPEHRLGEARRMRIDRRDDLVRRLLALLVPAAPGPEIVAEMLAEQATRHACPLGASDGSSVEGISISMIGCFAQPFTAASSIGAVHVVEARRHDDAGGQMIALLRQHREIGQLGRAQHSCGRSRFRISSRASAGNVGIDRALRHQPVEQQLGIDAGDNVLPRATPCRRQRRRPRGRLATMTSSTGVFEHDVDAGLAAGARHRLGDRTHAADRMAPAPGTPAASPNR